MAQPRPYRSSDAAATTQSSGLQWRRSRHATPPPQQPSSATAGQDVFAEPTALAPLAKTPLQNQAATQASYQTASNQTPAAQTHRPPPASTVGAAAPQVQHADFQIQSNRGIRVDGTRVDRFDVPQTNDVSPAAWNQQGGNFFDDPFGDDPPEPAALQETSTAGNAQATIPARTVQEGTPFAPPRTASPAMPSDNRPMNELRGRSLFDKLDAPRETPKADPSPTDDLVPPKLGQPKQAADQGIPSDKPSLGDRIRDSRPDDGMNSRSDREDDNDDLQPLRTKEGAETDRSDSDEFDNPFDGVRRSDRDGRNRDAMDDDDEDYDDENYDEEDDSLKPKQFSCGDFRQRISKLTIDQVSLDISAPYRPDEIDMDRYQRLKNNFDEKQVVRQWRNTKGQPLASGRLRDLAYEKAVIETEFGTTEELPIERLSEADLAYISENWGLPKQCLIEQVAYTPRSWNKTTMTWKASNLCHTPLYFEDVNLERYGHTRGPVLEPIVQSAHFFANIAVLPYKMGVHSPTECQYALGYYRPGNCAPWIVPPVPLSARGAWAQAATVTGLFWLIP